MAWQSKMKINLTKFAAGIGLAASSSLFLGYLLGHSVGSTKAEKESLVKAETLERQAFISIEKDLRNKANNYFYIAAKSIDFPSLDTPSPGTAKYPELVERVSTSTDNYAKNSLLFGQAYFIYADDVYNTHLRTNGESYKYESMNPNVEPTLF